MGETLLDAYFKNYFWTVHLVVIFLAALLLARTVNAFVGKSLEREPKKIAAVAATTNRANPAKKTNRVSLSAFLERNLFKAMREDIIEVPPEAAAEPVDDGKIDEDNCEPSSLGANLLATVVSSSPNSSLAMFQDTSANKIVELRIDDKLLDQATVHAIEWRRVLVRNSGRCEVFTLEDPKKAVSKRPSAPIAKASPGKGKSGGLGEGVKKVSDTEYEIPKKEIDNVLSNLNKVATQARIVPSFHNGKANGFKLFSIRPNSLYSKIGIQNGDIVQKINGYEMNSPDKALEIYSKLKDASTITVDLVRRGKSKTLSYSIR